MCLFSIKCLRFKRQCLQARLATRRATLSQILFVLKKDNPASSVCLGQKRFPLDQGQLQVRTCPSIHSSWCLQMVLFFPKLSVAFHRFSTDTDTDRMETRDNQITCSTCGSYHIFRRHVAPVNTHCGCDCRPCFVASLEHQQEPCVLALPPHRPHCKPPR